MERFPKIENFLRKNLKIFEEKFFPKARKSEDFQYNKIKTLGSGRDKCPKLGKGGVP